MADSGLVIPFGRAVRVGSFKLWRGRTSVGSGRDKGHMECIHVSSLDGSWAVRIPAATTMYSLICSSYATVDEEKRDRMLGMVLTNIYNVSTMGAESLHNGFWMLSEMMTFPYLLLSEKEMRQRMKEGLRKAGYDRKKAEAHVDSMCEYRHRLYELIERLRQRVIDDYERQQEERRAYQATSEDEDMRRDAIAEEAMDVMNGKGQD